MKRRIRVLDGGLQVDLSSDGCNTENHLQDLHDSDALSPRNTDTLGHQVIVEVHDGVNKVVHHTEDKPGWVLPNDRVPAESEDRGVMVPMEEGDWLTSQSQKRGIDQLEVLRPNEEVQPNAGRTVSTDWGGSAASERRETEFIEQTNEVRTTSDQSDERKNRQEQVPVFQRQLQVEVFLGFSLRDSFLIPEVPIDELWTPRVDAETVEDGHNVRSIPMSSHEDGRRLQELDWIFLPTHGHPTWVLPRVGNALDVSAYIRRLRAPRLVKLVGSEPINVVHRGEFDSHFGCFCFVVFVCFCFVLLTTGNGR